MAKYGKKRQRNRIIIGTFILIVVIVVCMTYYFQQQKLAEDPGYGKINSVEIEQNIMDASSEEEASGEILSCKVMDVGDAEAVLIDIGSTEILYDAGYAENGKSVVSKMRDYVDGELDFMIVSHSHADHCGGVPAVMKAYEVDTVITSGETEGSSEQFTAAMKSIKNEKCTVVEDDDLTFDLGYGAVLYIIEALDPGDTEEPNDLSVCAYVKYGEGGVLITGDNETEGEKALKGKLADREITLFVAGHHMSNTSNNAVLLEEWDPQYIFASNAGPKESEYGFPHKEAVERCLDITSDVYATYKSGDLVLKMDGKKECEINVDSEEALTADKKNVFNKFFN